MSCQSCTDQKPCLVPPHPDVAHIFTPDPSIPQSGLGGSRRPLGLNDGMIYGHAEFAPHISESVIAHAAANEPYLRGPINVCVVLVDFADKAMDRTYAYTFNDLFFSTGNIKTGSVNEYYSEVSGKKVSITGQVFGPFTLPHPESYYAHGGYGFRNSAENPPNTRDLGNDAVTAMENAGIDLSPFDNKGRADGLVDAFVVVHAGMGGEVTANPNDIWSLKWVLPGTSPREVGPKKTRVYPFLTIPEDAKLGVCVHELGHLLFGWPDFYDIEGASRGVGKWCVMGTGCWGAIGSDPAGSTPSHPSAWCKINQGWISLVDDQSNAADVILNDVKEGEWNTSDTSKYGNVHRLWSDGQLGMEYFLMENREQTGFDQSLPAGGLLIWHVDDAMAGSNTSKAPHFHLALVNADGQTLLGNDGDPSNIFPGVLNRREFNNTSTPNSRSYSGQDTFVGVQNISDAGPAMKMRVFVKQSSIPGEVIPHGGETA